MELLVVLLDSHMGYSYIRDIARLGDDWSTVSDLDRSRFLEGANRKMVGRAKS